MHTVLQFKIWNNGLVEIPEVCIQCHSLYSVCNNSWYTRTSPGCQNQKVLKNRVNSMLTKLWTIYIISCQYCVEVPLS